MKFEVRWFYTAQGYKQSQTDTRPKRPEGGGNGKPDKSPINRHKKNVSTTAVRPTIEALGMPEQDDETE